MVQGCHKVNESSNCSLLDNDYFVEPLKTLQPVFLCHLELQCYKIYCPKLDMHAVSYNQKKIMYLIFELPRLCMTFIPFKCTINPIPNKD